MQTYVSVCMHAAAPWQHLIYLALLSNSPDVSILIRVHLSKQVVNDLLPLALLLEGSEVQEPHDELVLV